MGWQEDYESERNIADGWAALQMHPQWAELAQTARLRCRALRDARGMLRSDADVATYNFELGMLAGIEWALSLPRHEQEAAQERADHALTMIREGDSDAQE